LLHTQILIDEMTFPC